MKCTRVVTERKGAMFLDIKNGNDLRNNSIVLETSFPVANIFMQMLHLYSFFKATHFPKDILILKAVKLKVLVVQSTTMLLN